MMDFCADDADATLARTMDRRRTFCRFIVLTRGEDCVLSCSFY
jgi:hypothetical protein